MDKEMKDKIAMFCDVTPDSVISSIDADSIYQVPVLLEDEGLDTVVLNKLGLKKDKGLMPEWRSFIETLTDKSNPVIQIALVGKYTGLSDSYLSVVEAIKHAGASNQCRVDIKWVSAEDIESEGAEKHLKGAHGVLIPGGFGDRGIEGKILSAQYARENDIPYLGLCLGMHIACIEFARNVIGLENAHSREINASTPHPIIDFLPEQLDIKDKGGTMRLGAYPCTVKKGTKLFDAYQTSEISERHRHRYEFNNEYREQFESNGLVFSGTSPDGKLVEVIENPALKWFVACQFHPEFKSRPSKSHPLFYGFMKAAKGDR
jgi:CTP synthase